jgi:biotin carboxyl carrier protein
MNIIIRIAAAIAVLFVVAIADIPYVSSMLVSDALALRGRGAAFAVGAAVGSSNSSSSSSSSTAAQQSATAEQQAATAAQQSATAQQQSATAQQQAAAAQTPAPPPAASGQPLPLGTVVATLPSGCTATPVGGVNYYYCGGNFYQAVYEGSTLKYITAKPK